MDQDVLIDRLTKENSALRARVSDLEQQLSLLMADELATKSKIEQINVTRTHITEQLAQLCRQYEQKIRVLESKLEKLSRLNESLTKTNNLYKEEQQLYESRFMEKERLLTMLFNQEQSIPYPRVAPTMTFSDEEKATDQKSFRTDRESPKKEELPKVEKPKIEKPQKKEIVEIQAPIEEHIEHPHHVEHVQHKHHAQPVQPKPEVQIEKKSSRQPSQKAQRSFVQERSRDDVEEQTTHSHGTLPVVSPPPPPPPKQGPKKVPAPPKPNRFVAPLVVAPPPQHDAFEPQPEPTPQTQLPVVEPVKEPVAPPSPVVTPTPPAKPQHEPKQPVHPPPVETSPQHLPHQPKQKKRQFKVLKFDDQEQPSTYSKPESPKPQHVSQQQYLPQEQAQDQHQHSNLLQQFNIPEHQQQQPTAQNFFAGLAQSQISQIPHSEDITGAHYFTHGTQITQPHFAQDSFATEDDHSKSMSESVNFFETLSKTPKPAEYPPAPKEKSRRNKLKVMDPSKFD